MRSDMIHTFLMILGFWTAGTDAQCSTRGVLSLNATATRTATASVPSCSIFTGTVVVFYTTEVDLNGWDTIDGGLEIFQYTPDDRTYIHSTTLRSISGHLQVRGSDYYSASTKLGIVNISFPALEYVGRVNVGGNYGGMYNGVSLGFGKNTTTEAVHMSKIQEPIWPQSNTLFLNISTVRDWIDTGLRSGDEGEIKENNARDFFSTIVAFNSSVNFNNNKFGSILMPQLEDIRSLVINENKELERIELAAVTAGGLHVSDNGRETSVALDRLTTLTGIGISDTGSSTTFSNLVSLKLPQLREVSPPYYRFSFLDNLFSELHLTNLEKVNGVLVIRNNPVLIDLTFPQLDYARQIDVRHNPRLLNFTANVLKLVEKVYLEGNFSNVEFFSLTEVTGDFKLIGSPSMDCSWFDDNFFQKVVKGGYQCIGNHTRPLVPRRPSTATGVAELDSGSTSASPEVSPSITQSNEHKGTGGLSAGSKAGIGAGVGIGAVLLLGVGAFIFSRRKKASSQGGLKEETEKAELGDNSLSNVVGDAQDIPEDQMLSPATVELDGNSGGLVETQHELGGKEVKSKQGRGTVERSKPP